MKSILMNQETLDYLQSRILDYNARPTVQSFVSQYGIKFKGIDIEIDNSIPTVVKIGDWVFPDEPFVQYEKSDESWCRYFGIGYINTENPLKELIHDNVTVPGVRKHYTCK